MFELLLVKVWMVQRFFRRKFRIIKIGSLSISTSKNPDSFYSIESYCSGNLPFDNYKKMVKPIRRILNIKDVCLNPKTGVAWYQKYLIEESSNWPIDKLLVWEPRPLFYSSLNCTATSLADNGFYHFLIEDLPRFLEVHRSNPSVLTVIGSKSRYVLDLLKYLNVTNYISKFSPIKCSKILLSERNLGGIFDKNDLLALQELAKDIQPIRSLAPILILRKNIKKGFYDRGVQYSPLLEKKFRKFGFETVYLEEHSFLDQISLIKSTSVLAGFHGAGLANMVWLNQNAKIIEISETRITSHFEHIANICELNYHRAVASQLTNLGNSEFERLILEK